MSSVADPVTIAPRFEAPVRGGTAKAGDRHWVRLTTFTALAGYGTVRWATLLNPAAGWRLAGLLALSVLLVAAGPVARGRGGPLRGLLAGAVVLAAFPVAGLRWHWFVHERVAASATQIGDGLQALPNVLVPYLGSDPAVRLVIVLGAAVLLLDAAVVLAFAPRTFGDSRRAAAALPLLALAVVPSTLLRPQFPYLQGLILFALVAGFVWGERLRSEAAAAALTTLAVVGVGAAIVAPRIDPHRPWFDYRAWAASSAHRQLDAFTWNQSYGPLHWPQTGHVVMTVAAARGDYWKAEDLDRFDGREWVAGGQSVQAPLPTLTPPQAQGWVQRITVTIKDMRTSDVIASGYAALPSSVDGGIAAGQQPGTWVAEHELGPGDSYQVVTYSPHPSAAQLSDAGRAYPDARLAAELTLGIPAAAGSRGPTLPVSFPLFHSRGAPRLTAGGGRASAVGWVRSSPYAAVYALARRLAARAPTPYAFAAAVKRYLSHGYTYNQDPPVRRYPLQSFLFVDKQGYCQQFSGAMAMLLRMGGVPAQVAAGFTSGTLNRSTQQWAVTDLDAHAWVEAWFPRYGWVAFDPTPPSPTVHGGGAPAPITKSAPGAQSAGAALPHRDTGAAASAAHTAHASSGAGLSPWLIVAGLALLIALGGLVRGLRRGRGSTEDLLAELERALARTRRPLPTGATLASLEHRFRSSPGAVDYVRALRLQRYGGQRAIPSAEQRRALRRELRQGLGPGGRAWALWALPPWPRRGGGRQTRS